MARQLLAFTRRQILNPKLLELNATLAGMGRLLQQLMGAGREVKLDLSPEAGLVYADEGQLEQVLLNLALNARDAMPRGAGSPFRPPPSSWAPNSPHCIRTPRFAPASTPASRWPTPAPAWIRKRSSGSSSPSSPPSPWGRGPASASRRCTAS